MEEQSIEKLIEENKLLKEKINELIFILNIKSP